MSVSDNESCLVSRQHLNDDNNEGHQEANRYKDEREREEEEDEDEEDEEEEGKKNKHTKNQTYHIHTRESTHHSFTCSLVFFYFFCFFFLLYPKMHPLSSLSLFSILSLSFLHVFVLLGGAAFLSRSTTTHI